VLPQAMAADPERLRRFEREAQTIASLSHPNIVTIHSVEESEGRRFITMELVEGKNLSEIIPPGGLPVSRFFELALPIVSAVSAAHDRAVAHRDLKPENVMVGTAGGCSARLRAGDERQRDGACQDDVTRTERVGQLLGTVPYMAPEQIQDSV
jgi:serine/threonine protein kinase